MASFYIAEITGTPPNTLNEVTLRYSSGDVYYDEDLNEYDARLQQPLLFQELLNVPGAPFPSSSPNTGRIELQNFDGGLDHLIDFAFDGRSVKISQIEDDNIEVIFTGSAENVTASDESITINIRDKRHIFDEVFSAGVFSGNEDALEGDTSLEGQTKPRLFGRVINFRPPRVHTPLFIYALNYDRDGNRAPVADIEAVFDRGVLLSRGMDVPNAQALIDATIPTNQYYTCEAEGLFRLGFTPDGAITVNAEESRRITNFIAQSFQLSPLTWGFSNTETRTGVDVAPTGRQEAIELTETTANGRHRVATLSQELSSRQADDYNFNVYLKARERSNIRLIWFDSAANNRLVDINLSDGTHDDVDGFVMQYIGNGWYHVSLDVVVTNALASASITMMNESGLISYPGVEGNGILLWGPMFHDGHGAEPYFESDTGSFGRRSNSTIVNLIRRIVTEAGGDIPLIDVSENLGGIVVTDGSTYRDVLDQLYETELRYCFPLRTESNSYQCGFLSHPIENPIATFMPRSPTESLRDNEFDILNLRLTNFEIPFYRIEYTWRPIHTVQTDNDLAGSVTQGIRDFLAREHLVSVRTDDGIKSRHPLSQILRLDGLVFGAPEAIRNNNRWFELFRRRRDEIEITTPITTEIAPLIVLGNVFEVVYPRFGLNTGKSFVLIGINFDAARDQYRLTLWG